MGCGGSAERKKAAEAAAQTPVELQKEPEKAEKAEKAKGEAEKAERTATTEEVAPVKEEKLEAAPVREEKLEAAPLVQEKPLEAAPAKEEPQVVSAPDQVESMQKMVDATWKSAGKAQVQQVLNVENAKVERRYETYAADLHRKFGNCTRHPALTEGILDPLQENINEMYLFHGCSPEIAKLIARTEFDMEEGSAVKTTFGKGLHLAECSSKADERSKDGEGEDAGLRALLLCKAVAGGKRPLTAEAGDTTDKVTSGEFDSVCGQQADIGQREMVFFNQEGLRAFKVILYTKTE
eukprot:CAMPEP_0181533928 /NCGR_PEP_ID=MMETSP1110-20121109/73429_1 /TAXON_ID=174948 /ORGANISM="Symbiodinium sp., Strain CCMP421" /LENGTH=293 /DNA_ID=CAMNT_0023665165 /DNA_START=43 /DNA_END=925 /DNA_ORIENTATION=-